MLNMAPSEGSWFGSTVFSEKKEPGLNMVWDDFKNTDQPMPQRIELVFEVLGRSQFKYTHRK